MNRDIIAIVQNYPLLHFQVNKGERHRIMRSGVRRGSLWVAPRTKGYSITPTGEVAALMHDFLYSHFGKEAGEDYQGRWKWWNIENIGDLSKIMRRYVSIELPNNTLQPQEALTEPSDFDQATSNHLASDMSALAVREGRLQLVEHFRRERNREIIEAMVWCTV